MHIVSYTDPGNHISGTFLTDMSLVAVTRFILREVSRTAAITMFEGIGELDAKRWEAEGLSVKRRKDRTRDN